MMIWKSFFLNYSSDLHSSAICLDFYKKYAVEFYIKLGYTKDRKGECDYAKYQINL